MYNTNKNKSDFIDMYRESHIISRHDFTCMILYYFIQFFYIFIHCHSNDKTFRDSKTIEYLTR